MAKAYGPSLRLRSFALVSALKEVIAIRTKAALCVNLAVHEYRDRRTIDHRAELATYEDRPQLSHLSRPERAVRPKEIKLAC